MFNFLRNWHTVSHSGCIILYSYECCLSGEGDGTPLQYSCLENPMDGGAWWAAVHGVSRTRTQLSDFTLFFHFHALEKWQLTVLAWRIPRTGEPGGLPSMGLHRVGHDWSDLAAAVAAAAAALFENPNYPHLHQHSIRSVFLMSQKSTTPFYNEYFVTPLLLFRNKICYYTYPYWGLPWWLRW